MNNSEERNNCKQTSRKMEEKNREKTKKFPVVIPYIKSFCHEIRRIFGQYNIPTYFTSTNTLKQLFVMLKNPVEKDSVIGPVWQIKCESCKASFVEESGIFLNAW